MNPRKNVAQSYVFSSKSIFTFFVFIQLDKRRVLWPISERLRSRTRISSNSKDNLPLQYRWDRVHLFPLWKSAGSQQVVVGGALWRVRVRGLVYGSRATKRERLAQCRRTIPHKPGTAPRGVELHSSPWQSLLSRRSIFRSFV